MSYRRFAKFHGGGKAEVVFPLDAETETPQTPPPQTPPRRPEPDLSFPALVRPFDAATFCRARWIDRATRVEVNYHDELSLEGRPEPDAYGIAANREAQLALRGTVDLVNKGGTIENNYHLQANADTARTNLTLIVKGSRGDALAAATPGSPVWLGPGSIEDQRATIKRFEADHSDPGSDALERWRDELDAIERRVWDNQTRPRVDQPAVAVFKTAPQPADLSVASLWAFEPCTFGDRERYIHTLGHTPQGVEIDPPRVRLNRRSASEIDLFMAPQTHKVVFSWIAAYQLMVTWWGVVLYFPTTRALTLRSGFWPEYFQPMGVPSGYGDVGWPMSQRIRRTTIYIEALLSDLDMGPYFFFLGRFSGRYGIYLRDHDAHAYCATVRLKYSGGKTDAINLFRRRRITRENTLIEVAGLYDPFQVDPYTGPILDVPPGSALFIPTIATGF